MIDPTNLFPNLAIALVTSLVIVLAYCPAWRK
jgi:hypothetical protein